MQRCQSVIYNGTLKNIYLIKNLENTAGFLTRKYLILIIYFKPEMRKSLLQRDTKWRNDSMDISFTWSDKAFKCTVVDRALPSLHGGSLEVTLTVPLRKWYNIFIQSKDGNFRMVDIRINASFSLFGNFETNINLGLC